MKKALRITGYILGIILLLLLGIIVAVQSPVVQTWLTRKAIDSLKGTINGEISIGKIQIKPFDAIVVKDLLILDTNPYLDPGIHAPVDTFAKASYITARFSLMSLLRKERFLIKEARVKDGVFNLVSEPNRTMNLERIFPSGDSPEDDSPPGDILEIKEVDIQDFTFRLLDYERLATRENGYAPGIDWDDLDLVTSIQGRDLTVSGGIVGGIVDHMTIREKSGIYISHLSGRTRVGNGRTIVEDIVLRDGLSDISIPLYMMSYENTRSFNKYITKVKMDGKIAPSLLDMRTIAWFAPALWGNTFRANFSGNVSGYVNDLSVSNISFSDLPSGVSGGIDGRVTGLPDTKGMITDFTISDLKFTPDGLGMFIGEWAPGSSLDLGDIGKGRTFTFNGKGSGPLNQLKAKGLLASAIGRASADLHIRNMLDKSHPMVITGTLDTDNLNVGALAGIDEISEVSLKSALQATLKPGSPEVRIDSLSIGKLEALGYSYTGIRAMGTYSQDAFDGRIVCNDPNLNFIFQGLFNLSGKTNNAAYNFYANVGYADLNALKLDKRERSKVSFQANANFMKTGNGDLIGGMTIGGLKMEDANGHHDIGDISIQSHSNDRMERILLNSTFAEGSYVSTKGITSMLNDLTALTVARELPALLKGERPEWDGTAYDMELSFKDTRDLLSFIAPGTYVAPGTKAAVKITENGLISGSVRSGRIAFNGTYLKDLALDLGNADSTLGGTLTSSELKVGSMVFKDAQGEVFADDGHIGISVSYDNSTSPENRGELYLTGEVSRNEDGILRLVAQALPSNIYYQGEGWSLSSDDIVLEGSDINVSRFLASCNDQRLNLSGGISPDKSDTLSVKMEKFDLAMLGSIIGEEYGIGGRATGHAMITSPTKPNPGILVSVLCDSTMIAGKPAGLLKVDSRWNEELKRFDLLARNDLDGRNSIDATGWLSPSRKTLEMEASLDRFDLGYAQPFLEGVFSRMGGGLTGKITASGPLSDIKVNSQDLQIQDGLLEVEYTGVAYNVNGPAEVSSQGIVFNDVAITDGKGGQGSVTGGVYYKNFQDMRLDIGIRVRNMLCLDTTESQNDQFYGHVSGTGSVDINGPISHILLDINASTSGQGDIHIPLNSASTASRRELLTFYEPAIEAIHDPYDLMMNNYTVKGKSGSALDVRLNLRATPDITAHVEVDKSTGNVLTGNGSGNFEILAETGRPFTINGSYGINSGQYRLSVMGLVQKDFTLQEGSSIKFNGDIMDSDLDIKAKYTTKTSLANLLSDSTSTRRTVVCGIDITDRLSNPQIALSIDVPDIDPVTKSQVESTLNTTDKIQRQFLYLLITGGFMPPEESGIVNNSELLYNNVSSIMSNQLNNIFQKLDIPLDLGLNYQPTDRGNDIFDVAVSTQLFNNRVVVNGTLGNRQYHTSGTRTDMTGDLDIEVKLDRQGTLRLNLFSHSADQYTSYLDNLQRNGAGLAYQREFDTFRQFFRSLFTSRKKRREREAGDTRERRTGRTVTLQIGPDGKGQWINKGDE